MSDMNAGQVLPEFRVGDVLSQTFSTLFGNFFKIVLLGILFYVVFGLVMMLFTGSFSAAVEGGLGSNGALPSVPLFVGYILGMVVLSMAIQAAITYGAIEFQAGRRAPLGAMLRVGMGSIVSVIIASIIIGIAVGIGSLLLLIPGIIIWLMMSITIPVIVAEGKGPFDAMERSASLTKGYKWSVFGSYIVVMIVAWLIDIVLTFAGGLIAGIAGASGAQQTVLLIVAVVSGALFYGLNACCVASIYTGLRAAKEGTGVDEIAKVFE
ncbi:MAG: hypothetical protein EP335_07750 [Alphaproteobacteria bacterium]|nr:MAG: hypothetical protein EP335_07750 [Alphaproteobacteria bacterium]